MRVAPSRNLLNANRASRKSGSTQAFTVEAQPLEANTKNTQTAAPSTLDALIALQFDSGDEGKQNPSSKAVDWSNSVLDHLEALQREILQGSISADALKSIEKTMAGRIDSDDDPDLKALQAQILLRAKVELAKLEVRQ